MDKQQRTIFTLPVTSVDYYFDKSLKNPLLAVSRTISMETPLQQNEDMTMLFVKGGRGEIWVNAQKYEISRGFLIFLGDCHRFSIRPAPGEQIELMECRFEYALYLYIMSNPYYRFTDLCLCSVPVHALTTGETAERVQDIADKLVAACGKAKRGAKPLFLVMRMLGILIRESDADFDVP